MVSPLSIIMIVFSIILCFGTPVLFYVLLRKRANQLVVSLMAGLIGFFVMQIIIRIPILSILQLYTGFYSVNIYLLAFSLGFTAALFETFGRVVSVKLFLKDDYRFTSGIAHGIGHGGVEAIMLVGLGTVFNLAYVIMINNGTLESVMGNSESILQTKEILINTPSFMFLLGGLERVLAILFHISLSVLVFYGFTIKRKYPIILVLLIHTVFDFTVIIMGHYGVNVYLIELFILLAVCLMMFVTYKIYLKYKEINQSIEGRESNV